MCEGKLFVVLALARISNKLRRPHQRSDITHHTSTTALQYVVVDIAIIEDDDDHNYYYHLKKQLKKKPHHPYQKFGEQR
jgi:hypothetical protein